MKKALSVVSAIALGLSMNASAKLDREEREEYVRCGKIAWVAEQYDITWFDDESWEETLALYHSEMTELEIRKLDKKVARDIQKIERALEETVDELGDYIPEEHNAYVIYAALMMDDKAQSAFYECQL